jgi:hypothetical protein
MEKAWKGGEVQKLRDGERRKRDALRLRDLLPHSLTLVRPSRHDQIRKVVVLVQQPELGLRVLEAPDLTVLEEAGGPAGGGEGFTDDSGLRRRGETHLFGFLIDPVFFLRFRRLLSGFGSKCGVDVR